MVPTAMIRPVGFDQPGNLARVRHHRLGEKLASPRRSGLIAEQIRRMMADKAMKTRCQAVAKALDQAGGAERAAEIVEAALSA